MATEVYMLCPGIFFIERKKGKEQKREHTITKATIEV